MTINNNENENNELKYDNLSNLDLIEYVDTVMSYLEVSKKDKFKVVSKNDDDEEEIVFNRHESNVTISVDEPAKIKKVLSN